MIPDSRWMDLNGVFFLNLIDRKGGLGLGAVYKSMFSVGKTKIHMNLLVITSWL